MKLVTPPLLDSPSSAHRALTVACATALVIASALFATFFAVPQSALATVPTSFVVKGGTEGVDYRLTDHNELWIQTTTPLTVSTVGSNGGDHIVVDAGTADNPARLTLDGVSILDNNRPINVINGHSLELTLAPGSTNYLYMTNSYQRQAIGLSAGGSLTIKSDASNPGSLSAWSGANAGAPVIGGSGSTISIEGGLISISAKSASNAPLMTDEDGGCSAVSITGGCFDSNALNPESPDTIYGATIGEGYVIAPNPNAATSASYPVLVGSEDLYKPSTLQLTQDVVVVYDGATVDVDDVVTEASQGAQDVTDKLSVSYAPEGTEDFVEGLPQDAGTYRVRASIPQQLVNGVWYSPATDETTLVIKPATASYRVTNQKLSDKATLSEVSAPEAGTGVTLPDGTVETVAGTLTWYASDELTDELSSDTLLSSLAQDCFVTLWWSFVPESANYAGPITGSAVIVIEKTVEPTPEQPGDDPTENPGDQTTQSTSEKSDQSSASGHKTSDKQAIPATGDTATLAPALVSAGAALSGAVAAGRRRSSRHAA